MQSSPAETNKRRQQRRKAVLPVRVRGKDASGRSFEELAHTLDVTPSGVRLGAIHHQLGELEQLTICYRQRRMEFRVIWTKKLKGIAEYQVGLQAMTKDAEAWGLSPADFRTRAEAPAQAGATGASATA
ncbi:MAG TPA: hypothetical protein VMU61_15740 [Candidatus Aquilonibacter sp.]|nr:hypothetical protein [Candidatus Aquilonibacter sp.]